MIIQPKVRGFLCTSAHPIGCEENVKQQIAYVRTHGPLSGPKNVLVIGASTGYGLASRITAAFGAGAKTVGVFFEKEASEARTASAGWYNSAAFHQYAEAAGLYAKSINGDAFSDEIKQKTIALLKEDVGPVDLVVYSLASPRRTHPKTGVTHRSVLKPIGQAVQASTLDTDKKEVKTVTIEPATPEEIADTVAVMGGEDWEMWINALDEAGLIAPNCQTVAYTYIGDKITWPIYGQATIGEAKKDLDRGAQGINRVLKSKHGRAFVAVLKAVVTQASSAIPIMPLYLSLLFKVMKEQGTHEGCIEQVDGLFRRQLYSGMEVSTDNAGRLRMDLPELKPEVQREIERLWAIVTTDTIDTLTDFAGYQSDFLRLFGYDIPSVDYKADVNPVVPIKNLVS